MPIAFVMNNMTVWTIMHFSCIINTMPVRTIMHFFLCHKFCLTKHKCGLNEVPDST